jgi:hypothetical protein
MEAVSPFAPALANALYAATGRRMEVAADAAAICREDQCGKVGNRESGGC